MSARSRTILSIDVGVKNLAYVLATVPASSSPMSVIDLACTDLSNQGGRSTPSIEGCTQRVVEFLTVKFTDPTQIDVVLVKRQGVKNPQVFAMSCVIFAYFHTLGHRQVILRYAGKKTVLVSAHFDDVSRFRIREHADEVYDAVLQLTDFATTT